MVEVKFYSYQGKPNVVDKSLGSVVATKNLNFITDAKPQLSFSIECDTLYDANYVTFPYVMQTQTIPTSKTLYWFINSIESYKNIWIYHLQLDVLQTYWDDIKTSQQMIERSYSLTPNTYLTDTLWKTGKDLDSSVFTSTGNPFKTTQSLLAPDSCVVLYVASQDTIANGRRDMLGSGGIRAYLINGSEYHKVVRSLYYGDFITAFENTFKTRPMDVILGAKSFPFNVADYLVGQEIDWNDASKNVDITVGNGYVLMYKDEQQITVKPYGRVLTTALCSVSLGYISVERPFGDFRDYPPYTDCKLWLPYLGMYDFDPTVYYSTGRVYIRYYVDLFSGRTTVVLSTTSGGTPDQYIEGIIGLDLPFGGADVNTMLRNIGISAISGAVMTAATKNLGSGMQAASAGQASKPEAPYLGPSPTAGSVVPVGEQGIELYYGNKGVNSNVDVDEQPKSTRGESPYRTIAKARAVGHFLSSYSSAPTSNVHGGGTDCTFMNCPQRATIVMYSTAGLNETFQKTLYGKLVMQPAVLENLSGFTKLTDCNISMNGMQADVYNELVSILESGFYIE